MGWCYGSEVMNRLIGAALKYIPDPEDRKGFYLVAIDALEDRDWDTQNECLGQDEAFDKALRELHPDWEGD